MLAFLKRTFVVLLGLLLVFVFIWYAGPYFAFAGYRPLESVSARLIAIAVIVGCWLAVRLVKRLRSFRASDRLLAAVVAQPQPAEARPPAEVAKLRERFEEAVSALQQQRRSGRSLYDLPWYLIIGAPGFRQDHGAAQFRPAVSAGAARGQRSLARRRGHAQLRLVVHGRSRLSGHGRAVHHAGLRCGVGQRRMERVPRAPSQVSRAPARQRRDRHGQRPGPAGPRRGGERGARRGGVRPAERADAGAAHPVACLSDGHQVRPGGWVRRVLRGLDGGRARAGVGSHVSLRADPRQRGSAGVSGGVRRAHDAPERTGVRARRRRAKRPSPDEGVRISPADGDHAGRPHAVGVGRLRLPGLRRTDSSARRLLHQRHPGRHAHRPPARQHRPHVRHARTPS